MLIVLILILNNGIPQGSILGLLLDICDLFLWDYKCDTVSYADDNTHIRLT